MQARWAFTLYPEAAEGGGCFVSLAERGAPGEGAGDPVRAGQEADCRARAKVRRYCAANRLNRLGTLTYAGAGCHDPARLRADVGEFFRGLRRGLPRRRCRTCGCRSGTGRRHRRAPLRLTSFSADSIRAVCRRSIHYRQVTVPARSEPPAAVAPCRACGVVGEGPRSSCGNVAPRRRSGAPRGLCGGRRAPASRGRGISRRGTSGS